MSNQKKYEKNDGKAKFKGKQILLLGLVALVITAGYYRWTVEKDNFEKTVHTAGDVLPTETAKAENDDKKKDKEQNTSENKDANQDKSDGADDTSNEKGDLSAMRRERDTARSEFMDEWNKIKADGNTSQESKKDAEDKIKHETEAAATERVIETQVKAKGYEDCFAYISENGISVTVKGGNIDGAKVAAIKDIIVNESHISVKNIKINSL